MAEHSSLIFRIADIASAVAALEKAREKGRSAILESPPRVSEIQGTAWFMALAAEASRLVPGVAVKVLIDCGDAAALAHDAIMRGADIVRFHGTNKVAGKLRHIAAARGSVLLAGKGKQTERAQ